MNPTFAITIEPARQLLRVTLSGFFDVSGVVALEDEKRGALARLGCAPNRHFTLVDVSACKLQAQDVVRAFQAALADRRFMSQRIAFVTGSSLARMQVRRMLERSEAAIFDTTDAAEQWLFQPVIAPRAEAAAPNNGARKRVVGLSPENPYLRL